MDNFLKGHPWLRRRYEADLRRLGTGCTGCQKGSLQRRYQKEQIKAQVKAATKPSLKSRVKKR